MSNFRIIGTCPRCNYETGETVSHTQILNSTRIEMHCDGCGNRFVQVVKEKWKKQAMEMNAPAPGSMAMVPPGKTLMDIAEKGLKFDTGKQLAGILYEDFPNALSAVADVATFGARKYARGNWLNVENNLERYTDAMHRHMLADARGEEADADSGLPHKAHAAWNALAILELTLRAAK